MRVYQCHANAMLNTNSKRQRKMGIRESAPCSDMYNAEEKMKDHCKCIKEMLEPSTKSTLSGNTTTDTELGAMGIAHVKAAKRA
jgi:hypothetical protein